MGKTYKEMRIEAFVAGYEHCLAHQDKEMSEDDAFYIFDELRAKEWL